MDYVKEQEVRQRARALASGMRALITEHPHEAAEQLASSLRALNGVSEREADAAKMATARRRARALSAELHKLDTVAWMHQQIEVANEYQAYVQRLIENGGRPVKSDDGSRWACKPGTKLLMKAAPGEVFPWEEGEGDE